LEAAYVNEDDNNCEFGCNDVEDNVIDDSTNGLVSGNTICCTKFILKYSMFIGVGSINSKLAGVGSFSSPKNIDLFILIKTKTLFIFSVHECAF
jgi:hypothetical protein